MKKTFLLLLAAAATITIVGCQKALQPDPQKKEFEVKKLRACGEVSPNPVKYDHCILTGYKETLESFRHVSKGRLYYMDYVAEFPFEELIVRDQKLRYKPNEYQEMMFRLNSLLYNDAKEGEGAPDITRACSQINFASKARVFHMMSAYKPVMSEEEALWCLQEGTFEIEVPNDVTNWSCIYNPAERTMLFNMRNDMSEVYSIDLKKDL